MSRQPVTVATLLWEPNDQSFDFSRQYDERWVERLYWGVMRHTTRPIRFVCFTDWDREFKEAAIHQERIRMDPPDYGACVEPYRLGEPMILMGLDTIITGDIDHLVDYCLEADKIAVPRDPFFPNTCCNGVQLVPAGRQDFAAAHAGQNDMEYMRALYAKGEVALLDDLFPGEVVSYKGHAMDYGPGDARIVYFHGALKPHELVDTVPWVAEAWR